MTKEPSEHAGEPTGPRKSSIPELGTPLDQERAASMADEGGVSAAITDALEQRFPPPAWSASTPVPAPEQSASRLARVTWRQWAFAGLGAVSLLVLGLVRASRHR